MGFRSPEGWPPPHLALQAPKGTAVLLFLEHPPWTHEQVQTSFSQGPWEPQGKTLLEPQTTCSVWPLTWAASRDKAFPGFVLCSFVLCPVLLKRYSYFKKNHETH